MYHSNDIRSRLLDNDCLMLDPSELCIRDEICSLDREDSDTNTLKQGPDTTDHDMKTENQNVIAEHEIMGFSDEDDGGIYTDTGSEDEDDSGIYTDTGSDDEDATTGSHHLDIEDKVTPIQNVKLEKAESERIDWDQWRRCSNYHQAQVLNDIFLTGHMSHNIFLHEKPMYPDRQTQHLMDRIFVIQMLPARQQRGKGISLTRFRGHCAFMLSSLDYRTSALAKVLLGCRDLLTMVATLRETTEYRYSFKQHGEALSMVETRHADSWEELEKSTPLLEDGEGKKHTLQPAVIEKYAEALRTSGCEALLREHPVIFVVTATEYERNIQTSLIRVLNQVEDGLLSYIQQSLERGLLKVVVKDAI